MRRNGRPPGILSPPLFLLLACTNFFRLPDPGVDSAHGLDPCRTLAKRPPHLPESLQARLHILFTIVGLGQHVSSVKHAIPNERGVVCKEGLPRMTLDDIDSRIEHILAMGSRDIAVLDEFPPEQLFALVCGFIRLRFDNRCGAGIEHLKPLIDFLVNDVVTVEQKNLHCTTNANQTNQPRCQSGKMRQGTYLPTIDEQYLLLSTHDTRSSYTPQTFEFLPRRLERLPRSLEPLPIKLARGARLGAGDSGMHEPTGIGEAERGGGEPEGVRVRQVRPLDP